MNLLTPERLRKELSISEGTYKQLVREGMPAIRIGKQKGAHRRYDLDKVIAWLEERERDEGDDEEGISREERLADHFDSREHYKEGM